MGGAPSLTCRELSADAAPVAQRPLVDALLDLGLGMLFGVLLVKSEGTSFRLPERGRSQAVRMYGLLGSAGVVAGLCLPLLRRVPGGILRDPRPFE